MSRPILRVGFAVYVVTATAVTALVFLEFASWGGFVGWLHAVVSALTCGCTSVLLWQFRCALRQDFRERQQAAKSNWHFRSERKQR